MVRNTLKYVANKDMKAFAKDLKTIYTAANEESAMKQLESVTKKWIESTLKLFSFYYYYNYLCCLIDNGLTAVNCCQAASIIIEDLNLQKKFHTVGLIATLCLFGFYL